MTAQMSDLVEISCKICSSRAGSMQRGAERLRVLDEFWDLRGQTWGELTAPYHAESTLSSAQVLKSHVHLENICSTQLKRSIKRGWIQLVKVLIGQPSIGLVAAALS